MPPRKPLPKKLPKSNSKENLSLSELKKRYKILKQRIADLDRKIKNLKDQGITEDLTPEMQALHDYNDVKDTTQMILGYLANAESCTVGELHRRYNLPLEWFIHCSAEEVEEYKRTGDMSNQILAEATRKNQLPGTPPICNQFKKGLCRRQHCKFRHVTKEQEDQEILGIIHGNIQRKQASLTHESHFNGIGVHRRNGVSYDEYQDSGLPLAKRRFAAAEEMLNRELQLEADRNRPVFKGYIAGAGGLPPPGVLNMVDTRTLMLEEENNILHNEISQLKKQVQDLTATNEFLLDQNATLRVSSKQSNMPAVSLTSTNTQPQVIRTVTASVATVPVSLATVTTGTVSGNPVSIASIAGCPTVSIASPAQILAPSQQILVTTNPGQQLALATSSQQQIALTSNTSQQIALANTTQQAQQIALANAPTQQQLTVAPQQITLTNNQQLLASTQQIELHRTTMSNGSQPMVSYPIMTQSLNHPLAH